MKLMASVLLLFCLPMFGQNVGIGTDVPTEPLEVNGIIFTSQGGVKFPDGTVQTTAYVPGTSTMMPAGLSGLVIEFAQVAAVNIMGPANDGIILNALNIHSAQEGIGVGISVQNGILIASAPSLSELTISRTADFNTAQFKSLILENTVIPYVEVFYLKSLPNSSYVIDHISRYENCMISGFNMSSGGDSPSESINIAYTKACYRSYKRDASGVELSTIDGCFNLVTLTDNCSCAY